MTTTTDEQTEPASVGQIARYFLRLGFTAFGGPAAHIAMMEDDLVARRRWLSRAHFLDMLAATQLVPGPNSTEMAIHVGYVKAGVVGLIVGGLCFIMPAFLIVLALSIAYMAYGALPATDALFYGIQPVIVAIVIQAAYRLGKTALKTNAMRGLALAAFAATLLAPIDPVWVIVVGGLAGLALMRGRPTIAPALLALPQIGRWTTGDRRLTIDIGRWTADLSSIIDRLSTTAAAEPVSLALAQAATNPTLIRLALFFLKVGATLLGSGYLLISYLQNDLVGRFGWLTPRQLVDAIAVGQMTPGPVFTTAAFVGYVVRAGPANDVARGTIGALVCAWAIFFPSFVIVALLGPLMPRLRSSSAPRAFLNGVNAAVVGTIAATTWTLFQAAAINLATPVLGVSIGGSNLDLPSAGLALVTTALLLRDRAPNSTLLIAAGAALGLFARWLAGAL